MSLKDIESAIALSRLDTNTLKELQTLLKRGGFYTGRIDGLLGPLTRAGLADFKHESWLEFPSIIGETTVAKLFELKSSDTLPYFNGGGREETVAAIIREGKRQYLNKEQIAYILGTTNHETNNTFEPVIEAYWMSEAWRRTNLRYWPYVGRGFVQLTWRANYSKYQGILDVPLVDEPDRALEPAIALYILVHGMKHGIFTGRKLGDYINEDKTDWYNARKVVNWTDRADHIANLSKTWLSRI